MTFSAAIKAFIFVYFLWITWETKKFFDQNIDEIWRQARETSPLFVDICYFNKFARGLALTIFFFGAFVCSAFWLAPLGAYLATKRKIYVIYLIKIKRPLIRKHFIQK